MFNEYVLNKIAINYESKIMVFDKNHIIKKSKLEDEIISYGFEIIHYNDVEQLRFGYETLIKKERDKKYLILVEYEKYVPYDIRQYFYCVELSLSGLFPQLNASVLEDVNKLNYNLLYLAYEDLFENLSTENSTTDFIENKLYEEKYVKEYINYLIQNINQIIDENISYLAWLKVSQLKARISFLLNKSRFSIEDHDWEKRISKAFNQFILEKYGSLSGYSYYNSPALLNKVIEHILLNSKKVALIVMDGMSVADWLVIEDHFSVPTSMKLTYALVPTVTSISRQSLLSSKLPIEHEKPFSLSNEKKQFIENLTNHGYARDEIKYHRGYNFEVERRDRFICTIINDIDDLVHSQLQGKEGLYEDILKLAKCKKLEDVVKKLFKEGFQVYITSDHGNTSTIGIGKPKGTGVEVETKSQRMIIYKDYAEKEQIIEEFNLREYPGYYLPKDYKYLICEDNESLGYNGKKIVSHGGINIDEVIVPIIRVEGVE